MTDTETPTSMTPAEAAAFTGLSTSTLISYEDKGQLPFTVERTLGNHRRYPVAGLTEMKRIMREHGGQMPTPANTPQTATGSAPVIETPQDAAAPPRPAAHSASAMLEEGDHRHLIMLVCALVTIGCLLLLMTRVMLATVDGGRTGELTDKTVATAVKMAKDTGDSGVLVTSSGSGDIIYANAYGDKIGSLDMGEAADANRVLLRLLELPTSDESRYHIATPFEGDHTTIWSCKESPKVIVCAIQTLRDDAGYRVEDVVSTGQILLFGKGSLEPRTFEQEAQRIGWNKAGTSGANDSPKP